MQISEKIIKIALKNNYKIAVAESFTGGLIANSFVSISGSSDVFFGGIITNCNQAKTKLLDIPEKKIVGNKVYSKNTAVLMAESILKKTKANLAISSTGVASGISEGVQAGTCFIGIAGLGFKAEAYALNLSGSRNEIRKKATEEALKLLLNKIS